LKELSEKKCAPCEGGVEPLKAAQVKQLAKQLHKDWKIAKDYKTLKRSLKFKDFYRTMSFVNAVAHVANTEDHHPDMEVGYGYCHVTYSTHSIGGLSVNDFICAAKLDRL
jgi:4a-hydroxytetrahydrobiopterin dehydratase